MTFLFYLSTMCFKTKNFKHFFELIWWCLFFQKFLCTGIFLVQPAQLPAVLSSMLSPHRKTFFLRRHCPWVIDLVAAAIHIYAVIVDHWAWLTNTKLMRLIRHEVCINIHFSKLSAGISCHILVFCAPVRLFKVATFYINSIAPIFRSCCH